VAVRARLVLGCLVLVLYGCGGGGGSTPSPPGGGAQPGPNPGPGNGGGTPPHDEPTQPSTALTTGNAFVTTHLILETFEITDDLLGDSITLSHGGANSGAGISREPQRTTVHNLSSPMRTAATFLRRRSDEAPVTIQASVNERVDCESGNVHYTGQLDDDTGTGTVTARFNDCVLDGVLITGGLAYTIEQAQPEEHARYRYTHDELTFRDLESGEIASLTGTAAFIEYSYVAASSAVDLTVSLPVEGITFNAQFTNTFRRTLDGHDWRADTRQGRMIRTGFGRVNLQQLGSELRLTGRDSELLIYLGLPMLAIYLDDTGDARFEWIARVAPDDLGITRATHGLKPVLDIDSRIIGDLFTDIPLDLTRSSHPGHDFIRFEVVLRSSPPNGHIDASFTLADEVVVSSSVPGEYELEITTRDPQGASDAGNVQLRVRFDAPALALSHVPESLANGEKLYANVDVTNPHLSGAVHLALAYGPPGMIVDGNGVVSWDPDAIDLFGEGPLTFGIRGENEDRYAVLETTVGLPPSHAQLQPIMRSGLPLSYFPRGSHQFVDIDGDGSTALLAVAERGYPFTLKWSGSEFKQTWAGPLLIGSGATGVFATDEDSDGLPEIFVVANDELAVLDGATRRVLRRTTLPYQHTSWIHVADVDGDGALDIVFAARGVSSGSDVVVVLDAATLSTKQVIATALPANGVAKLDGELGYMLLEPIGRLYDLRTQTVVWTAGHQTPAITALRLGADHRLSLCYVLDGNLIVRDAATKETIAVIPNASANWPLAAGDINGNGTIEVILAESTDENLWIRAFDPAHPSAPVGAVVVPKEMSSFMAADITGDGRHELIFARMADALTRYAIADLSTGTWVWESKEKDSLRGPFLGGQPRFPGATQLQFLGVTHSSQQSRIVTLERETGLVTVDALANHRDDRPSVQQQDQDGDGQIAMLVGVQGNPSRVYLHDASGFEVASVPLSTSNPLHTAFVFAEGRQLAIAAEVFWIHLIDLSTESVIASISGYNKSPLSVAYSQVNSRVYVQYEERIDAYAIENDTLVLEGIHLVYHGHALGGALTVANLFDDGRDAIIASWYGNGSSVLAVLDADFGLNALHEIDAELPSIAQFDRSAFVAIRSKPGSFGRPGDSRLMLFDPAAMREVWRSPPLVGTGSSGSAHVVADGTGRWFFSFGTDAGMFYTK
jgi:hypothetical protein